MVAELPCYLLFLVLRRARIFRHSLVQVGDAVDRCIRVMVRIRRWWEVQGSSLQLYPALGRVQQWFRDYLLTSGILGYVRDIREHLSVIQGFSDLACL